MTPLAIILITMLIPICCSLFGIYLFKKYTLLHVIIFSVILSILFITFVKMPIIPEDFYSGYDKKFQFIPPLANGCHSKIYKHLEKDKIYKQMSPPTYKPNCKSHIKTHSRKKITPVKMLSENFMNSIIWQSLNRIKTKLNHIKYFPKIYELNKDNYTMVQEYIPYSLDERCPSDFEDQIKDFNILLYKSGYIIDDVHLQNWRVSEDGIIKIIDCEVYTPIELYIVKIYYKLTHNHSKFLYDMPYNDICKKN